MFANTDTQTRRQTDRWVDHNTPHPYRGGVINKHNTLQMPLPYETTA